MKLLLSSVLVLVSSVACGSAPPPAASAPVEAPAPSSAPAPEVGKACGAAGGKCMPLVVTVACKSQPASDCAQQQFCCVM
jgi:hypothetical protein